jgi:hypothetical protein
MPPKWIKIKEGKKKWITSGIRASGKRLRSFNRREI